MVKFIKCCGNDPDKPAGGRQESQPPRPPSAAKDNGAPRIQPRQEEEHGHKVISPPAPEPQKPPEVEKLHVEVANKTTTPAPVVDQKNTPAARQLNETTDRQAPGTMSEEAGANAKCWVRVNTFLPQVLFLIVLVCATQASGPKPQPGREVQDMQLTPVAQVQLAWINKIVVTLGSLIPFAVLTFRLIVVSFPWLTSLQAIGREPRMRCLPSCCGWNAALLGIWIAIAVFRLLSYLLSSAHHAEISNHIWLISSLIAMLQMEFSLLHVGLMHGNFESCFQRCRCHVALLVGWALLLPLLVESYVTARFYHTNKEVWTSALGGLCYQIPVMWWLYLLNTSRTHEGYKMLP